MPYDRNGLRVLDADESLRALEQHPVRVGRVGLDLFGRPVILPVNYAVHDGTIIIRTSPGAKLAAAQEQQVVAFEVDVVDEAWEEGWSVLVQGHARRVEDPDEIAELERLPLRAWAGERSFFMRIEPDEVSGRQIV